MEEVWIFDGHADSDFTNRHVFGIVIDSQNYVYTASRDRTLRKLSPDGGEIWKVSGRFFDLTMDYEDYLYLAGSDGTVRKYDPEGNELWRVDKDIEPVRALTVGPHGYLYAGSGSFNNHTFLRKIDLAGNQIWEWDGTSIQSMAVDSNNYIYIGSMWGRVTKLRQID